MASTFSSSWSVTTVPTRSRAHVERLASSSAIRIYTSYSGTRSTGATDAPVGTRFKKCVLAATPSLGTLMQVEIGIVVGVLPPPPPRGQPGIEAGRYEPVGALLALGGAEGEVVGVLVLGVVVVAADPAPLDRVPGGRLHQLLPQRQILDRAALAAPAARHPAGNPVVHPLDQVLGIGHVGDAGVAPLAVQPLERGDGARERHAIVGRVGGAFLEGPARGAVTGRRATAPPGVPASPSVTRAPRGTEGGASPTPPPCRPAPRSAAAWIRWIVLPTTVAKRAASSSARWLVSRPSNASAQEVMGEGSPPHTSTQRSAIRMSEPTVGPRAAPLVGTPRRPTSTASAAFATSASSTSGSPSRSTSSARSPAVASRSLARSSIAAPLAERPLCSRT